MSAGLADHKEIVRNKGSVIINTTSQMAILELQDRMRHLEGLVECLSTKKLRPQK